MEHCDDPSRVDRHRSGLVRLTPRDVERCGSPRPADVAAAFGLKVGKHVTTGTIDSFLHGLSAEVDGVQLSFARGSAYAAPAFTPTACGRMETTMRRTAWILAALGLAGSTLRIGFTDDLRPTSRLTAGRTSRAVAPTEPAAEESDEPASSQASRNNYYDELFGDSGSSRSSGLKTSKALRTGAEAKSTGDSKTAQSGTRRRTALKPLKQISPSAEEPRIEGEAHPSDFAERRPSGIGAGAIRTAEDRPSSDSQDNETISPVAARPFPGQQPAASVKATGAQRNVVRTVSQPTTSSLTEEIDTNAELVDHESSEALPELDFSDTTAMEEAPEPPAIAKRGTIVRPPAGAAKTVAAEFSEDAEQEAAEIEAENAAEEAGPIEEPAESDLASDAETSFTVDPPSAPEHPLSAPAAAEERRAEPSVKPAARLRRSLATELQGEAPVRAIAATGSERSAGVTAEWVKKSDITIGQECVCDLVVKNTTDADVADVEVEAYMPSNVELVGTSPAPTSSGQSLVWKLQSLKAGESQAITIRMIPRERGNIATQAFVRFSKAASTTFSVAEPMLAVELSGPQEVMVGEAASQTVTVRNPGTGIASNVKVEALIPSGLEHSRGDRLVMDLGSLNPGEARPVRLALAAISGGRHTVEVRAQADGDLIQTCAAEVSVIAPKLAAEIQGPGLRYLGRQAVYTLTVNNDGAANTDNVRVMHKIPEGFEFVSSDKGSRYDSSTRLLTWFVGSLGRGETAESHVTLKGTEAGSYTHFIRATSEQGIVSDSQVTTRVEGAANLSLDVEDADDPIEIGAEASYTITVANDGSADAANVALSCEIPDGAAYVVANGPVSHSTRSQRVEFRPIGTLAPGESAKFQVTVRGLNAGNLRFRARLTSDAGQEPLSAEEVTKFYGE